MYKFDYNGEHYYIRDFIIYNDEDIPVTEGQASELAEYYIKSLNFNDMEKQVVYDGIRFAYIHKVYEIVPRLIRIYFDREDVEASEKKVILPKLAEVYRKLGDARKAVNLFKYLREFYGDYLLSTEFIAEVAQALCDLGKYDDAKDMCEWAYTLRKPNLDAIATVYMRIQKETGEI